MTLALMRESDVGAERHPPGSKRIDLYQLGLFNLRFRGYFYKDSGNLCPDITKNQSCQQVFAVRQVLKFS